MTLSFQNLFHSSFCILVINLMELKSLSMFNCPVDSNVYTDEAPYFHCSAIKNPTKDMQLFSFLVT
jgi:hypothetical protein